MASDAIEMQSQTSVGGGGDSTSVGGEPSRGRGRPSNAIWNYFTKGQFRQSAKRHDAICQGQGCTHTIPGAQPHKMFEHINTCSFVSEEVKRAVNQRMVGIVTFL